jgi:hypothetical protein
MPRAWLNTVKSTEVRPSVEAVKEGQSWTLGATCSEDVAVVLDFIFRQSLPYQSIMFDAMLLHELVV